MPAPAPGNDFEIRRALARVEAANNEQRVLSDKVCITHCVGEEAEAVLLLPLNCCALMSWQELLPSA